MVKAEFYILISHIIKEELNKVNLILDNQKLNSRIIYLKMDLIILEISKNLNFKAMVC
jgi:hypothetical protein